MNRKLLALAIGAVMSLPFAAHAAPTLYGQLNMSLDRVDFDTTAQEEFQVVSNKSRLGVKGEETLGNGLSAVYKAEWEVSGDLAGTTDFKGRDRFLGLKSDALGTIKLGAYDSPLKSSQGTVDQFNDQTYLDMTTYLTGENRINNVIGYESPKIADVLTINVAAQSGEDTSTGDDDGVSVSAVFQSGNIYLAAAMDNDIVDGNVTSLLSPALPDNFGRDALRLTGVLTIDTAQVGAMVQTSEFHDSAKTGFDADETAVLLSGNIAMGKNVLKGQVVLTNVDFGGGVETDTQALELGIDHNFTQATKVYALAGYANYDYGTGTDDTDTVVSVGMLTKF